MLTKQNVALQIIMHSYILPHHPLLAQQTMTHGTSFKLFAKIIIKIERKDEGSTFTSPFTPTIGLRKKIGTTCLQKRRELHRIDIPNIRSYQEIQTYTTVRCTRTMTNIYTENQHRIFQHKDGRASNPVTNVLPGMNPESMMT